MIKAKVAALNTENGHLEKLKSERKAAKQSDLKEAQAIQKAAADNAAKVSQIHIQNKKAQVEQLRKTKAKLLQIQNQERTKEAALEKQKQVDVSHARA